MTRDLPNLSLSFFYAAEKIRVEPPTGAYNIQKHSTEEDDAGKRYGKEEVEKKNLFS